MRRVGITCTMALTPTPALPLQGEGVTESPARLWRIYTFTGLALYGAIITHTA
jgi:hypothetical protein